MAGQSWVTLQKSVHFVCKEQQSDAEASDA
jgi:hypothetical protein